MDAPQWGIRLVQNRRQQPYDRRSWPLLLLPTNDCQPFSQSTAHAACFVRERLASSSSFARVTALIIGPLPP